MTLLRAAGISLAFGSRPIFHDLELVIEESERVGLIGVNGSGKSTLMRILAGAQPPDAGELQAKRGARITVLPQEPAFDGGATVESEMLAGGAQPHEGRALVDRLGVKDWDRPLSELSGGARKRVAIARALLTRPDLLMLDEPTNHLDADTVDWLEEELDRLQGALLAGHARSLLPRRPGRSHRRDRSPARGWHRYPGQLPGVSRAEGRARGGGGGGSSTSASGGSRRRWRGCGRASRRGAPRARRASSGRGG